MDTDSLLVIGAGAAGLAAARELRRLGFSVTVVEARDRIGGRVYTHRGFGAPIELGASWIHGVDGNLLADLANELGLATRPTDYENVQLHDFDGTRRSRDDFAEIREGFAEIREQLQARAEWSSRDLSVKEAVEQVLQGQQLSAEEARALQWALAAYVELMYAAELDELSVRDVTSGRGNGGGDVLLPGGYDQIIRALAEDTHVRLGEPVQRIEHGDAGVRVTTTRETLQAACAVVTLPLGVLKRGGVEISPALSPRKQRAITRMEMGTLDKIALVFPGVFWPADRDFVAYASKRRGELPVFMNLHHAIGVPALLGFVAGPYERELAAVSDEEATARAMKVLRTMFGGDIPSPTHVVRTRWSMDPYAFGSYSHLPAGATAADREALAEPEGDRLFFAGEATHGEYPATVHGAILSGLREARRIARLFHGRAS